MWSILALVACIVFIVAATTWLKLHPFLALLLAAISTPAFQSASSPLVRDGHRLWMPWQLVSASDRPARP